MLYDSAPYKSMTDTKLTPSHLNTMTATRFSALKCERKQHTGAGCDSGAAGWTAYGRGMLAVGVGYDAEGPPKYGSGIATGPSKSTIIHNR